MSVPPTPQRGTSNPSGRAGRHTPEAARGEIAASAVCFLSANAFRDLTVGELMGGTTLSRPAFYQYFRDLHDLLITLLEDVEAAMRAVANPWIAGEGDPIAAVRSSLGGVVAVAAERGPILRAVSEAAPLDARLETAWHAFTDRWDDAVTARIEAQQHAGLVRSGLDARRTAHALNAMDAAVLVSEFGRYPQGDPDAVLEALNGIWVGTLYGCPPASLAPPEASTGA